MEFLHELQNIRNPFFTNLFELITVCGEELFVLSVVGCLYWCLNKKLAYRICFTYFASGLLVQTLKITFRIPRPWIRDVSLIPVDGALETATGYSFPSGHTQSATALFGTLAIHFKKHKIKVLMYLMIALVGFSRLYLGVHTPADVLVSFGISILLVILVDKLMRKIEQGNGFRLPVAITLAAISIGVLVYSLILYQQGIIETVYVSDCCKAAGAGLGFAVGWYVEGRYINFNERTGSIGKQLLKLLIGLVIVLAIKMGLKYVIGTSLPADIFRYFLMVVWAMAIYPYFIKKYFNK